MQDFAFRVTTSYEKEVRGSRHNRPREGPRSNLLRSFLQDAVSFSLGRFPVGIWPKASEERGTMVTLR